MKDKIDDALQSGLSGVRPAGRAVPDRNAYGVWVNDAHNIEAFPFKGIVVSHWWANIEPAEGAFNWTEFDTELEQAASLGLYACVGVSVGPYSPEWIYEKGVPRVMSSGHRRLTGPFPYYLDSLHVELYHRLIEEFGHHVRSLPERITRRIFYALVMTGSTQDEHPYKGVLEKPEYIITSEQWHEFRLGAFRKFNEAFQQGPGQVIPLLFNNLIRMKESVSEELGKAGRAFSSEDPAPWQDDQLREWVMENVKGGWGHKQQTGHCYQLNNEADRAPHFRPHLIDPEPDAHEIFTRCELDNTWQWGIWQSNIRMSTYWTVLYALHNGLSVWHPTRSVREWFRKNQFWGPAHFFNKYASQTRSSTAIGSFCALREGLDSADTEKFPEAEFGLARRDNPDRYLAICDAYAARGAKMDSVEGVLKNQMNQRLVQKGLNDAGWRIFPGNYERFLHQIDPEKTSVGWWRVGGEVSADSPMYARFARGFDHASGKNAMRFDIKDSFFSGRPLNDAYPVTVRVVYYDEGTGQWALKYDAVDDPRKTAYTVTKTNTRTWEEKIITLSDAYFGNRCDGADLMLFNTDDEDDIFHMIEVTRESYAAGGK